MEWNGIRKKDRIRIGMEFGKSEEKHKELNKKIGMLYEDPCLFYILKAQQHSRIHIDTNGIRT